MAVLLACGPAPAEPARAERAEPARWKIKVGERLRYTVARASSTSFRPGGEIKLTVVADFAWDVTAVGADGTADVTASVRRVRWEKNGVVPAYDSAKPKPEGDDLAPVIVGREARFRLTPGGRVTDFAVVVPEDKLPDSTRAALADGRRDPMFVGLAPTAATMFYESEDALRTLVDETAVPLPDAPLEPGAEPWRDADGRPGGCWESGWTTWCTASRTRTPTRAGSRVEARDAAEPGENVVAIHVQGKPIPPKGAETQPPADGAPRFTDEQFEGTLRFDMAAGRLVGSETTLSFKSPPVPDESPAYPFKMTTTIRLKPAE